MSSTGRRVKGTRNGQRKGEACASIISESVCQKLKNIQLFGGLEQQKAFWQQNSSRSAGSVTAIFYTPCWISEHGKGTKL